MNVTEIMELAHIKLDDTELPYLWTEAELIQYLNKVYFEWARDVRCLTDSSTVEICQVPLIGNIARYDMDERILSIENAYLSSGGYPLTITTEAKLNLYAGVWRTVMGTPECVIPFSSKGHLKVYPYYELTSGLPAGSVMDTLMMDVVRYPLSRLSLAIPTESPEIPEEDHINLIFGIEREAYLKQDSQTFDKNASMEKRQLFEDAKADAKSTRITLQGDQSVYCAHDGAI